MSRTKSMPASAEAVFEVLTDLDALSAWLPPGIDVDRYGPDLLRLWIHHGRLDEVVERRVDVHWDQLSISWGEPTAGYSGTVKVLPISHNRSAVSACLTGPSGAYRTAVEAWLDRALRGLSTTVAAERRAVPWLSGLR